MQGGPFTLQPIHVHRTKAKQSRLFFVIYLFIYSFIEFGFFFYSHYSYSSGSCYCSVFSCSAVGVVKIFTILRFILIYKNGAPRPSAPSTGALGQHRRTGD